MDDALVRQLSADPLDGVVSRHVWAMLGAWSAGEVAAWVAAHPDLAASALSGIEIHASRAHSRLVGSDRDLTYPQGCAIRSGLEYLRHGFLSADLDDPAEALSLDRWDDVLEIAAESGEGPVEPPPGTPPDHWWWRAQTDGRPENKDYDPWDPDTY
jgi:hypothetical protein